ncbi:MAG: DUF1566 domain-containing protein [Candidatus Electrothrix sp. MAN1_4]|nr:DUF1566 domain-containing protein [Candidatus Electrothrix sp. MAN1_4]
MTYPNISDDITDNRVVVDGDIIKERFFETNNLSEWNNGEEYCGESIHSSYKDPEYKKKLGFGGNYHYTSTVSGDETSAGKWYFDIPESGEYKIYVIIPHWYATTKQANYEIFHNNQTDHVLIDQNAVDGSLEERWTELGVFDFRSGNDHYVRLGNNTGETGRHVAFDAIKLVQVSSEPDPEPVISSISPLTATLDELTTFTVTGSNLPSTLAFWTADCDNVTSLGGTSTSMQFSCTPSWTTGEKNGVVKDETGGNTLYEFTVDVSDDAPEESFTCTSGEQTAMWKGREWQRCDDGIEYTWEAAKAYCENLVLGGHSDWYLPTIDELKSLVVCTDGTPTPLADWPDEPYRCGSGYTEPTIDPAFECHPDLYWSSTPEEVISDDPLASKELVGDVDFGESFATSDPPHIDIYVRCVR